LHTSILERLTGALCDAVTEQPGSQARLEALERANLFLAPLDSQRRWYRYHRLFADLLRYRLQQSEPERASELHRRAAVWLEQNGLPAEAVPHALQAQAFDLAARLIQDQAEGLLLRGETATLMAWGKGLPPAVLGAYPKLAIHQASAVLISGDLEVGQQLLDLAEAELVGQAASEAAPDRQRLLGQADAIRCIVIVAQGHLSRAIELAQRALERLPPDDLLWRNVASIGLANSYRTTGDIAAAEQIYARIAASSEANGSYYTALLAAFAQGCSLEEQGRLRQAETVHQRSLQMARRWNQGNPQTNPTEGLA
jgi:LuxR family maltose regulon positive regulatory protein